MKSEKGITLVALVITIIILLILAGIAIGSLTESGLFDKTREAENKYGNAANEENNTFNEYGNWINNYLYE